MHLNPVSRDKEQQLIDNTKVSLHLRRRTQSPHRLSASDGEKLLPTTGSKNF